MPRLRDPATRRLGAGLVLAVLAVTAVLWATSRGGRPPRALPAAAAPQRIAALGATGVYETLLDFGAFDRIVAVTEGCHYPGSEGKVRVKGDAEGAVPNVEAIVALSPDLVIVKEAARPVLEAAGLRVLGFHEKGGAAEIDAFVRAVGAALQDPARAEEIVARIAADRERLLARTAGLPRVRVYYEHPSAYRTKGRGSFGTELIEMCGGVNVAGHLAVVEPTVNAEFVVQADPEVIVLSTFTDPTEDVLRRPGWSAISAVRNGRVVRIRPEDRLLWSSRWIERGERLLLPWIHPETAR